MVSPVWLKIIFENATSVATSISYESALACVFQLKVGEETTETSPSVGVNNVIVLSVPADIV